MNKSISKPTSNGATETPTANPASIARCGVPAPSANGRGNIKLALGDDVVGKMAALEKPLPAQAQAILYQLDQLGGMATQAELIKALDAKDSVLATTQGATRIVTFYRKRLLQGGLLKVGG
tara:strand:- start:372 stop:734 length:363 start_codon:yes stop_codon:yes gene_type:complete